MDLPKYPFVTRSFIIGISLFLRVTAFGQIALIHDPDGFTNIREAKNKDSKVLYRIKENEVFFVDSEYIDLDSNWIKVWIPATKFSRYPRNNSKPDLTGFVHRSRIQPLEHLSISNSDNPKLIFQIEKANTREKLESEPFGLEIPMSMSFEIVEMKVEWNGKTTVQDRTLFDDLYNTTFKEGTYSSSDSRKFTTFKHRQTYFIRQSCADGAGYYQVVWVIENGIIIQRLAGWIN